MDKNLENRLQAIKAHEQAIKEQKDFIRASFIAALEETTNPSTKKIGKFLHIISYKDLENWDVNGIVIKKSLSNYIVEKSLCETLKVIKKLENCAAKNKNAEFHVWLKVDGWYNYFKFSIPQHFVKGILKNFYSRLGSNG